MRRKIPITIILTCLNETRLVQEAVQEIKAELSKTVLTPRFIVVDDGSVRQQVHALRTFARTHRLTCLEHPSNQGRGTSVADGIRAAKSEIVGFIDPDLEIPARYIFPFAYAIHAGADVVCAVRFYDLRMKDIIRIILSKGYSMVMRGALGSRLQDTESGLKFFRRKSILPLLDRVEDTRWFWDTELMVRSEQAGLRIVEIPTVVVKRPEIQTTVHLFADTIYYIRSLWRFRKEIMSS